MIREDVIWLISEEPNSHGAFDKPIQHERMVYCSVRSVSSSEFWRAYQAGLTPEYTFVLSDPIEYQGEKLLRYGAQNYEVLRTYVNSVHEIEIIAKAARAYVGNAENGA